MAEGVGWDQIGLMDPSKEFGFYSENGKPLKALKQVSNLIQFIFLKDLSDYRKEDGL